MAVHATAWGDKAFRMWDEWSRTVSDSNKYDEDDQQKTWESFDRPRAGARITVATIFHMAREKGWDDRAGNSEREPTQRDKLLLVGLDAEFWHDKDHEAFATVKVGQHQENYPIKSTAFGNWLTREYGDRYPMKIGNKVCPSAPSTQALTEAINALHAKALIGCERRPAIRIAEHDGLIYIDLGQPQWNAVEISSKGWRVMPQPAVRFVRPRGLRPLATPVAGGCLSQLREFVNVGSDADFVLVIGWLIAALRPTGPYPVLIINGEHGAGKSICCRVIRRLIDPNAAELRSEPREERDLLLAAKNGWIVALDNLSYVKNDLSDAICRIATKGAFGIRALYTDDEEFLLEVCRPVLLNGIPPLAARADLADRAVVLVLPNMNEKTRRTEEEFWEAFEAASPRIFGALLDGLSGALRCLPSTELQTSTRMMDFVKLGEAACRGLGAAPGTFEAAYAANRSSANEDAVDADPVAGAVLHLATKKRQFIGTATELLNALEAFSPPNRQDRRWPKDATRLSGQLRRVAPLLRPRGIEINFDRTHDAARNRLIEIKLAGAK
jgi:Primase C terminal 2 (PriCT-2)